MAKKLTSVLLLALGMSACGDATPEDTQPVNPGGKGDIIGTDDRRDEYSEDVSDQLRELGRSTAMVIQNDIITTEVEGGKVRLLNQPLGQAYYMCPDETFWEQPVTGMCTAWLVAPDTVVTNGHCVTSQLDCQTKSFVFDFSLKNIDDDLSMVPQENIVACKEVVAWDYTSNCDIDFAVIKLERPITDRPILEVRAPGEELKSDNLVIIGHPFGLPRKYATQGELLVNGSNTFTTTHDIFGGNSGSAIFDAESGEVQGLVSCGGSNLSWEYYNEGWRLDKKTGKACDTSCDVEGLYTDGLWEDTCVDGQRRRCVCDGTQLVWEKRACLSFENDTQGTCAREYTTSEEACRNSPWLCAAPTSQHTNHFAHFVGSWDVYRNDSPITVEAGQEMTTKITIEDVGHLQAMSVFLDFFGDLPELFDPYSAVNDLTITLQDPQGVQTNLNLPGDYRPGTSYRLTNVATLQTRPFEIPFQTLVFPGDVLEGEWTLIIQNNGFNAYTLHNWRIQALVKGNADDIMEPTSPCLSNCLSSAIPMPDPIVETFEGTAVEIDENGVSGRLTQGWTVEVIDAEGVDYEVFKSRKSQTMSLTRGEFAIVKDFGMDIGDRSVTVDYRYDGEGWFQIWADNHILYTANTFWQSVDTLTIPAGARTLKFVVGATDDSRAHELTLFSLTVSPPAFDTPAE